MSASMLIQLVIVGVVVVGAGVYLALRAVRASRRRGAACDCGCGVSVEPRR